ncbi:hypothetical protein ABZP36_016686 [Zizania latifolia]
MARLGSGNLNLIALRNAYHDGRLLSLAEVFTTLDQSCIAILLLAIDKILKMEEGQDSVETENALEALCFIDTTSVGACLLLTDSSKVARHMVEASFDLQGRDKQLAYLHVFGSNELKMLGYYSMIGLLKVPCLLHRALEQFPEYRIKVIGHSMGTCIAATLTYMLCENKKLSSSLCIAFGPVACMTCYLDESRNRFITAVVNRNDLVPSFGKVLVVNFH